MHLARRLTALMALLVLTLAARPARAWYFPEHAEITRIALEYYAPPFVTRTLSKIVAEARWDESRLPCLTQTPACVARWNEDDECPKATSWHPPPLCSPVAMPLISGRDVELYSNSP